MSSAEPNDLSARQGAALATVQFSLRSLMITMLVVAAFFAGWNTRDWYLKRDKTFRWMDEMGTVITVDEAGNTVGVESSRGSTFDPNGF